MLELPPPRLFSASGHANLNLRSHILFNVDPIDVEDMITSSVAWSTRLIHEQGHWIRYHGSTTGLLLTLLRDARERTANGVLLELDKGTRNALSARRSRGLRLFSFSEFQRSVNDIGKDLSLWSQIWLDLYFAYQAIFDSEALEFISWDSKEALNGALADAWLHLIETDPIFKYPGNETARSILADKPIFLKHEGKQLTTRLLFECASALDELYYVGGSGFSSIAPDILDMTLITLLRTEYGLPFRTACNVIEPAQASSTVCAIIDFALNPPIPGVTCDSNVTWSELYPPARYARALTVVKKGDLLSLYPETAELLDFRNHLISASGLRYGTVPYSLSNAPSLAECLRDLGDSKCEIREVLLYIAGKLLPLRSEDPSLVSHYGTSFMGEKALLMIDPFRWNDAIQPFCVSWNGKHHFTEAVSKKEATAFLAKIATESMSDEIVNGTGQVDLSHLPPDFASSVRDRLTRRVTTLYSDYEESNNSTTTD